MKEKKEVDRLFSIRRTTPRQIKGHATRTKHKHLCAFHSFFVREAIAFSAACFHHCNEYMLRRHCSYGFISDSQILQFNASLFHIRESGKLNSTLNLIERGNCGDAQFLWMNHLANDPTIDVTWMCSVTSNNGIPLWDCWSDEFVHFCTLRMMKFVEVNDIGICDKCGSGSLSMQAR